MKDILLREVFIHAEKIIDEGRSVKSTVVIEESPDSGVNIKGPSGNGITIRPSLGNGQVEILINGYRIFVGDINVDQYTVGDLLEKVEKNKELDGIEKQQVKNAVLDFIKLC